MDLTGNQVDASPEETQIRLQTNLCEPRKQEEVIVPCEKDGPFYKMNHRKRGLAFIFSHVNYKANLNLKPRRGTEADLENLNKTLKLLGFEVKNYVNLTYEELYCEIKRISTYNFNDCDCLLIAVLSHGEENVIYAQDRKYAPHILFDRFTPDQCPTLAEKPKIYLIQACQGHNMDDGVRVEVDGDRVEVESAEPSYRIPLQADFLVVHSTIPGYYSWRNSINGSWFIQAFCEEVEKYWQDYDLMTILIFINRRVAFDFESNVRKNPCLQMKKQIPSIMSALTRSVRFGVKNEKSNEIK